MELSNETIKIFVFIGTLLLTYVIFRINRYIFKKIYKIRKALYLRFFERMLSSVILVGGVVIALSSFGGFDTIWKTMLGGTAFISAVLIFAAQDVIKDNLAGLMITVYKPFEIGNRVQLQDTQVIIVPNSKLNAMSIRNYSYMEEYRSALFQFHIAYDSDVEKAMRVIAHAIMESEYSVPGKKTDHGMEYGPIYFMAFEDSSLRLTTTVYYEASSPSEVVISDINLRVDHALRENGIEIPYAYLNVVQKERKHEDAHA